MQDVEITLTVPELDVEHQLMGRIGVWTLNQGGMLITIVG